MITIKELAKECGVSIATVSNVINGTGRVGSKTAQKVLETAERIGYVPNMLAKNLKQRENRTIGIITEDLTVFNAVDIVDGIHAYLDAHGYTFLLGNLRLYKKYGNDFYKHESYMQQVHNEFQVMRGKQVAGIIYIGAHNREIHSVPADFGLPVVMAYGQACAAHLSSVVYDDEQGGYDAVMQLLVRGHRRIGVIAGERGSSHTKKRLAGCKRALLAYDIADCSELLVYGDWSRQSGYEASKTLWARGISAIFAMSDEMAAGVYDFAQECRLKIGSELALVGYDNREIAASFSPALATIALPLTEIGTYSAKLLLAQLADGAASAGGITELKCAFVERASICENKM